MTSRRTRAQNVGTYAAELVDAFHREAVDEVQRLLARVGDEHLEVDDSGGLIEWDAIPNPDDEEHLNLFEYLLDEDRLEALENGEPLTPRERAAWTRAAVEDVFTSDVDSDVYPTWCVATLTGTRRRRVVVAWLVYGYSVTELTVQPVGAYATRAAAKSDLRQRGITSRSHYAEHLRKERAKRISARLDKPGPTPGPSTSF